MGGDETPSLSWWQEHLPSGGGRGFARKVGRAGHRGCWAFVVLRVVETSEVRAWTRQAPGRRGWSPGRTEPGIEPEAPLGRAGAVPPHLVRVGF